MRVRFPVGISVVRSPRAYKDLLISLFFSSPQNLTFSINLLRSFYTGALYSMTKQGILGGGMGFSRFKLHNFIFYKTYNRSL